MLIKVERGGRSTHVYDQGEKLLLPADKRRDASLVTNATNRAERSKKRGYGGEKIEGSSSSMPGNNREETRREHPFARKKYEERPRPSTNPRENPSFEKKRGERPQKGRGTHFS